MCQDLHGFEIKLTGPMGNEERQEYRKARIVWAIWRSTNIHETQRIYAEWRQVS